jgi:hypothetical protein
MKKKSIEEGVKFGEDCSSPDCEMCLFSWEGKV